MLGLAACGSSPTNSATHTPASPSTAAVATASPSGGASPTASGSPGPASLVHCPTAVPAGDNLVIGTVVGDPTIVVRDIQHPPNAKNLCTIDSTALAPKLVSASAVAYDTRDNQNLVAPLHGGPTALAP